ncbi:RNA polymerase sigma factor [Piscinibacter sp.]|uniref:RNA polymerase sigma factor n=1 Tax=Piscinibacter sp. TaxID=1903157 RepID=UPI00355AC38F
MTEQDRSLAEAFRGERARLRSFIRHRVADPADAEDILQDVFYELVEAARLVRPVEQVGAWLFRVARNRITDLFRRNSRNRTRASEPLNGIPAAAGEEPAEAAFEDLLPSPDAGPEAAYARRLLLEELDDALDELPEEQRSVFVAHELDGLSFKELAARTGVSVNTLLSRKRYAVLHLRRRLQAIHDEFVQP